MASLINVVGLSAAVACAVAMYLLLQVIITNDGFHAHGDRLFLVEHTVAQDGGTERWGTAPLPLGPALEADFPQVERAVRFATPTRPRSRRAGRRCTRPCPSPTRASSRC